MDISGWIQLVAYVIALAAITKPMGLYLMRVLDVSGKTWLDPVLKPLGARYVSPHGRGPRQGTGLETVHAGDVAVQPGGMSVHLCHFAAAAPVAAQSAGFRPVECAPRLQHGREFHHQHQLAELRRRVHHVVFLTNGRTGFPQFRFRSDGHRHRRGARARHRAPFGHDARQFLGGPGAGDVLPAVAHLSRLRGVPRVAGHDSELQTLHHSDVARTNEGFRGQGG